MLPTQNVAGSSPVARSTRKLMESRKTAPLMEGPSAFPVDRFTVSSLGAKNRIGAEGEGIENRSSPPIQGKSLQVHLEPREKCIATAATAALIR
jgi:hypothetical protein